MWQWKWKCAKWHAYSEVLTTAATKLKNIETVQKLATRISVEILKAAKQTIPGYKKRTQTTFSVRDPEIERLLDEPNQDKVDKDAIAEGIRKIKRNIIECDMTGMDYQWAFRKVKQLEGGIVDNNISELEHEGSTTTDPKEMADIFTTAYATQFNLVDDEVPSLVFENKPGDEGNEEFTMRELKRQLKKIKRQESTWTGWGVEHYVKETPRNIYGATLTAVQHDLGKVGGSEILEVWDSSSNLKIGKGQETCTLLPTNNINVSNKQVV